MSDLNRTQMSAPPQVDPNKTQLGAPIDPNKTVMGSPSYEATVTIKPVQCLVCKTFNPPGVMFCVECGLIFDKALDGDAFGAPAVQVPVLVDRDGREFKLRAGAVMVGRQGDILVEDSRMSRQHAKVSWEGANVFVEDLGSTNGTMVNGERTSGRVIVENGATVSFGGVEMKLGMPGEANKTLAAMSGKTAAMTAPPVASGAIAHLVIDGSKVPLVIGRHTFGRKPDNGIQFADPYVSGKHGEFEVTDEGVSITDMGSTNGTFVNEARLPTGQKTLIHPGDAVRLGQYVLEIVFAGQQG